MEPRHYRPQDIPTDFSALGILRFAKRHAKPHAKSRCGVELSLCSRGAEGFALSHGAAGTVPLGLGFGVLRFGKYG